MMVDRLLQHMVENVVEALALHAPLDGTAEANMAVVACLEPYTT